MRAAQDTMTIYFETLDGRKKKILKVGTTIFTVSESALFVWLPLENGFPPVAFPVF